MGSSDEISTFLDCYLMANQQLAEILYTRESSYIKKEEATLLNNLITGVNANKMSAWEPLANYLSESKELGYPINYRHVKSLMPRKSELVHRKKKNALDPANIEVEGFVSKNDQNAVKHIVRVMSKIDVENEGLKDFDRALSAEKVCDKKELLRRMAFHLEVDSPLLNYLFKPAVPAVRVIPASTVAITYPQPKKKRKHKKHRRSDDSSDN